MEYFIYLLIRIEVPRNLVIYYNVENMKIPQILKQILVICGEKEMEFILQKEGSENEIIISDISLILNLPDFEDKDLESKLNECLVKLKSL